MFPREPKPERLDEYLTKVVENDSVFHGNIHLTVAQKRLEHSKVGDFLIRQSPSNGYYWITVKTETGVDELPLTAQRAEALRYADVLNGSYNKLKSVTLALKGEALTKEKYEKGQQRSNLIEKSDLFFGNISGVQAAEILNKSGNKDGSFLIRYSESVGDYVYTLKTANGIVNHILTDEDVQDMVVKDNVKAYLKPVTKTEIATIERFETQRFDAREAQQRSIQEERLREQRQRDQSLEEQQKAIDKATTEVISGYFEEIPMDSQTKEKFLAHILDPKNRVTSQEHFSTVLAGMLAKEYKETLKLLEQQLQKLFQDQAKGALSERNVFLERERLRLRHAGNPIELFQPIQVVSIMKTTAEKVRAEKQAEANRPIFALLDEIQSKKNKKLTDPVKDKEHQGKQQAKDALIKVLADIRDEAKRGEPITLKDAEKRIVKALFDLATASQKDQKRGLSDTTSHVIKIFSKMGLKDEIQQLQVEIKKIEAEKKQIEAEKKLAKKQSTPKPERQPSPEKPRPSPELQTPYQSDRAKEIDKKRDEIQDKISKLGIKLIEISNLGGGYAERRGDESGWSVPVDYGNISHNVLGNALNDAEHLVDEMQEKLDKIGEKLHSKAGVAKDAKVLDALKEMERALALYLPHLEKCVNVVIDANKADIEKWKGQILVLLKAAEQIPAENIKEGLNKERIITELKSLYAADKLPLLTGESDREQMIEDWTKEIEKAMKQPAAVSKSRSSSLRDEDIEQAMKKPEVTKSRAPSLTDVSIFPKAPETTPVEEKKRDKTSTQTPQIASKTHST